MKAKITFEDDGENIIIGTENAVADIPTLAQEIVCKLFREIKKQTSEDTFTKLRKARERCGYIV